MSDNTYIWYYLDPDNNKKEPKGMHCVRCKRSIKETMAVEDFRTIELHPTEPWFRIPNATERINPKYAAMIGTECLRLVKEKFGVQQP